MECVLVGQTKHTFVADAWCSIVDTGCRVLDGKVTISVAILGQEYE